MAASDLVILTLNDIADEVMGILARTIAPKDRVLLVVEEETCLPAAARGLASVHLPFDDPEAVLDAVRSWLSAAGRKAAAVIGTDEEYHYAVSRRLATGLGLPVTDPVAAHIASNKLLQRRAMAGKVRQPAFQTLSHAQGVDAGHANVLQAVAIPFPNVLKRVTGIDSTDVLLNHDSAELARNLAAKLLDRAESRYAEPYVAETVGGPVSFDPRNEFIIEEMIVGDEYSCDIIVRGGVPSIARLTKKLLHPEQFPYFEGFYLLATEEAPFLADLTAQAEGIRSLLSLRDGIFMIDFRVRDGKVFVLEFSLRPGISTFIDLIATVRGTTSFNLLIRQLLGLAPEPSARSAATGLLLYLTAPHAGLLETASVDLSALRRHGALSVELYRTEGEMISNESDYPYPLISIGHVLFGSLEERGIAARRRALAEHSRISVSGDAPPRRDG